jgi:hypothetical protein
LKERGALEFLIELVVLNFLQNLNQGPLTAPKVAAEFDRLRVKIKLGWSEMVEHVISLSQKEDHLFRGVFRARQ